MIILFAVLGSIVLFIATNYLNKVIGDALAGKTNANQDQK